LRQAWTVLSPPQRRLVPAEKNRLTTRVTELMMNQLFTGAMTNRRLVDVDKPH